MVDERNNITQRNITTIGLFVYCTQKAAITTVRRLLYASRRNFHPAPSLSSYPACNATARRAVVSLCAAADNAVAGMRLFRHHHAVVQREHQQFVAHCSSSCRRFDAHTHARVSVMLKPMTCSRSAGVDRIDHRVSTKSRG